MYNTSGTNRGVVVSILVGLASHTGVVVLVSRYTSLSYRSCGVQY